MHKIELDLGRSPRDRWFVEDDSKNAISELIGYYLQDLGMDDDYLESLGDRLVSGIPDEFVCEIEGLSVRSGVSRERLLALNLYYDFTKLILGCTAFAVETDTGLFHARNLDWLSSNKALSRLTQICHYVNGPKGKFTTIGWPGSVGALSGMADKRFSITLNASLSNDERIQNGVPVSFLIREVLQYAASFDEAVEWLTTTKIPCDCLLLVTGIKKGEAVAIERTPTRYAHRWINNGFVAVTNDYVSLKIGDEANNINNALASTSCGRMNRIVELLEQAIPTDEKRCFGYLSDQGVIMDITEQQMVFNAERCLARFEPTN